MKKILVTGGTGFVGKNLVRYLEKYDYTLYATSHQSDNTKLKTVAMDVKWFNLDLSATDMSSEKEMLDKVDTVIHLAARVHEQNVTPRIKDEFININIEGTRRLVEAAARNNVKQFIYLSSIKVNGEQTRYTSDGINQRFTEEDIPEPGDPYSVSKLQAENIIRDKCNQSGMSYVILRTPVIYGPGVKANFLKLIKLVECGVPLPFASIKNSRSLLYVENLCDAIRSCMENTVAANRLYLVSDADVSVPELCRQISLAMDRRNFIYPFPVNLLTLFGFLVGKKSAIDRLTESLLIDNSRITTELDWKPRVSLTDGLKKTTDWYRNLLVTD